MSIIQTVTTSIHALMEIAKRSGKENDGTELPADGGDEREMVGIGGMLHTASQRMQTAGSEDVINADADVMALIGSPIAAKTAFRKTIAQAQIHCPIDCRKWYGVEVA